MVVLISEGDVCFSQVYNSVGRINNTRIFQLFDQIYQLHIMTIELSGTFGEHGGKSLLTTKFPCIRKLLLECSSLVSTEEVGNGLVAHSHKHVVEHDLFHLIKGWDVQISDVAVTESLNPLQLFNIQIWLSFCPFDAIQDLNSEITQK